MPCGFVFVRIAHYEIEMRSTPVLSSGRGGGLTFRSQTGFSKFYLCKELPIFCC